MTNIIACIDGSNLSQSVCDAALWTAKTTEAPLQFLHVLDKTEQPVASELSGSIGLGSNKQLLDELVALDEQRSKVALKYGKLLLKESEQRAQSEGLTEVSILQRHGNLVETLLDIEDDLRVLVVGKSGKSNQNATRTVGSHLESVVRSIKAHTLVVSQHFTAPSSYMLAFDGSEISQKLIDKAISTPLLKGMTCHLVMVDDNEVKVRQFGDAVIKLTKAGINVVEKIIEGEVHTSLLNYQYQHELGLIVMGAYGHSKLRQFFVGSNTTKLLIDSTVPVLLIR